MYLKSGIPVLHLGRGLNFRVLKRIWQLLQNNKFDIVEIYGLRLNLLGRIVCKLSGQPVVVTMQRSVDAWRRPWHTWLDRLTSRWVSLYIANSQAAADALKNREKIPLPKIKIIENGIDTYKYDDASKGLIRTELGIDPNHIVITCVANFRQAKDHRTLIDAIYHLKGFGYNISVWLAGEGPLYKKIFEQVKELELTGCVKFLGSRLDIPEILADTDVFVLSSLWEGMPGVIMEAMASKLPVVATSVGGIPELVIDNETGLLVPPGNPALLAEALEKLIKEEKIRTLFGHSGYDLIVSLFNLEDKVKELEGVYYSLAC